MIGGMIRWEKRDREK